ncbi:ankyrin repeat-containing domain protein [Coprinopsis sp. MPI-PUGE-AT-0042]|nr:ankyrin repeat-containing domain protein [Coprinopsis sp. MPI-PUGE-AT-0042]
MDDKRKRSPSPGQLVANKRARWEDEVAAPPSECVPTASGPSMISGVQSAHIHDGTFTVIGTHNQTTVYNYNYGPPADPSKVLRILKSLSLPNFRDIQLDTLSKATEGTCLWFARGDMFLFWIAKGKILWGIGIPGAGKTVLASILIRDLERREEASGGVICLAYVYLRYSESLVIRDILESLVKQVVERHLDLVLIVEGLYTKHNQEGTKPCQEDLMGVLAEFIRHGKLLFFVLDALDEMRVEDRPVLLRLLASLDAKLLITSRPLEILQQQYPQAQMFKIAASPSDLDLHIKDFLRNSPEVVMLLEGTTLEEQLVQTVHQKSGGMFLHAKLQLEALRNCISALDVEEMLEEFPTDIQAIYMKTWDRILAQGPKHSNLAKQVLLWITHAHGEMTIDVLRRAVATSPKTYSFDPKRMVPEALLISVCCGLVSVDEKTKLVRLIHYTTRDAILPKVLELFPCPHAILAHVCISHLTNCGFQNHSLADGTNISFSALLEHHNDILLTYAHRSWAHHSHECGGHTSVMVAVRELVLNCRAFPLGDGSHLASFGGPLHVAALYSFEDLIPQAAQLHSPNVQTKTHGLSPLMLAVEVGNLVCAKALLSLSGIDTNLRDVSGETALIHAAIYGHIECVQLLVEAPSIDINARDNAGEATLIHAAAGAHTPVLKLLCEVPGIDVNTADNGGRTALVHAVRWGHTEAAKLLIGLPSIDVNAAENDGSTALMYAASGNLSEVVKLICEVPGIDINAVSDNGWTALVYAAYWGHTEAAKLLLSVPGTDVTVVDKQGETALSKALEKGHKEIADLLLAFRGH